MTRNPYPSDVTDDEWAFVAPYLTLMKEDAPQRDHDLHTMFSGERAGYDGYKRKKGNKIHIVVDTLGLLLAAHVTPANEQERAQVKELAEAIQEVTQQSVKVAFVDQGYTGDDPKQDAEEADIELVVVKLPETFRSLHFLALAILMPQTFVQTFAHAF